MFVCDQFWPRISSFLEIYFICNYMCWGWVLTDEYRCPQKLEESIASPEARVMDGTKGTHLGPLQEQYVLLTAGLCVSPAP